MAEPVEPQGAAPAQVPEELLEAPPGEVEELVEGSLEVQPEAPEAAPGAALVALLVLPLQALGAAHSAQVEVAPRELLRPPEVARVAPVAPGVAQEAVVGQVEETVVAEVGWLEAVSPPVLAALVAQVGCLQGLCCSSWMLVSLM